MSKKLTDEEKLERKINRESKQKEEKINSRCEEIIKLLIEAGDTSQVRYDVQFFVDYFGVGEATINRDIKILRNKDVIEFDRKIHSYKIKQSAEQIYSDETKKNLAVIASLKGVLQQYKNTPMASSIEKLIFILEPRAAKNAKLLSRISVPPQMEFIVDERNWNLITRAMELNKKISFRYTSSKPKPDDNTRRIIQPYQILLDEGSAYLFGFDEFRNREAIFRLNKIRDLMITTIEFVLPEDFDISTRTGGGKLGAFKGNELETVRIQFFEYGAEWIKEHKYSENQTYQDMEDGSTIITFTTTQSFRVLQKILSWGKYAKPLEPQSLVNQWKNEIQEMFQLSNS